MADSTKKAWVLEEGIGENRALLLDGDEVLAAKLHWPGEVPAGTIVKAKLTSKASGSRRGTAVLENGAEVLVDHLPDRLTEGAHINLRITRTPIAERGRFKRAQGRFSESSEQSASTPLAGTPTRRFPTGLWEDVWHAASSGQIGFAGGSAVFSATPAMALIDVDGDGSPRDLSLAAIPAIARGLAWFDLGGNIGIDFPTIESKRDRKAVDTALGDALRGWSLERTAMNGFGFVQIVARLEGPSLLHRFASSRLGMCARKAMRIGELAGGTGPALLLTVHPALKAKLKNEWLDELARRTGKQVRIESDPGLALETPQAQIVSG